jgi:hypothetical protein
MLEQGAAVRAWILRHEGFCVYALGALCFIAIPLFLGHIGISWDALNHHFYLGWSAEQSRLSRDYVPAGYQAYQYPYLYWPVYKLAFAGASGTTTGVVLALLNTTAIPPVWMMARSCIPETDAFSAAMRVVAVLLAFLSGVVLSLFDATSNDLLAGIPLIWAYALALQPVAEVRAGDMRYATLSGAAAGMAVAFKLSNGPLAIVLPLLWLWPAGPPIRRIARSIVAGLALLASYTLLYGYWGWELWTHFGNPIYPMYDDWFARLRDLSGWHR